MYNDYLPYHIMKKLLFLISLFILAFSCTPINQENNEDPDDLSVKCETGDATDIDPTSATINGSARIANAKDANGAAFFYYSATDSDAKSIEKNGSRVSVGSISNSGGSFNTVLTSLSPNTKYYYIASVSIDDKSFKGDVMSFTTKEKPKELTTTGSASDITEFSANLSGYANLTPDMGEVTMGILYSTNESPSLDNGKELTSKELDGNNMYTVQATYLTNNTTYYYKSFVKYGGVYRYGEKRSFTTLDFSATVETKDASDIKMQEVILNGSLTTQSHDALSKSVWFLYDTASSDIEALKKSGKRINSKVEDSGFFSISLNGLTTGTTYYYVACANVQGRLCYGDIKTFTTSDQSSWISSFSTNSASDIRIANALISGSIEMNKTDEEQQRLFFLYSESSTVIESLKSGKATYEEITKPEIGFIYVTDVNYHGTYSVTLPNLNSETTYYYIAAIEIIDKVFFAPNTQKLTTQRDSDYGQAVDLGLSVKWRDCDLGATAPEEYGSFFSWGEVRTKTYYEWSTYKWSNGDYKKLTKYCTSSFTQWWDGEGTPDGLSTLLPEDDAASVILGGNWRMPTIEELQELRTECNWLYTQQNGVNGYRITSKKNGNSIFLALCGSFSDYSQSLIDYSRKIMSSTLYTGMEYGPHCLRCINMTTSKIEYATGSRQIGFPVRPVIK